jgi:hypothetical protein
MRSRGGRWRTTPRGWLRGCVEKICGLLKVKEDIYDVVEDAERLEAKERRERVGEQEDQLTLMVFEAPALDSVPGYTSIHIAFECACEASSPPCGRQGDERVEAGSALDDGSIFFGIGEQARYEAVSRMQGLSVQ